VTDKQLRVEFGTDGIRGIAGEFPLDPLTVLKIGRAIGRWIASKPITIPEVLIGRDTRTSGDWLLHTLTAGLLVEGVQVDNVGRISTPGIAYITRHNVMDLGIMISASHNPFEQNGIKLFGSEGFKLDDAEEEVIEMLIAGEIERASDGDLEDPGWYFEISPKEYVDYLVGHFELEALADVCVVIDAANGGACQIGSDPFGRLGANVSDINAAPNGKNINVDAGSEYVRRDRSAILAAIREHNADLGIAFDGDADRVVFVTPEGMLVDGDHILGILALEFKEQNKLRGDTVVATDMSNSGLEHFLADHGIKLSRTKVGDRYVMERMRENDYILGGEQAGHIIILDGDLTTGDGIYVGLLVASIVARNKRNGGPTLHELASRIPRYPQVIASAHMNARIDLDSVSGLADLQRATLESFDNKGRVNVRFSGTEPNLLRAMVEGGPNTSMAQVIESAIAICSLAAQATQTSQVRIDIVDCVTGAPIARGTQ
jgi:phosphoglucosamine mutase